MSDYVRRKAREAFKVCYGYEPAEDFMDRPRLEALIASVVEDCAREADAAAEATVAVARIRSLLTKETP